MLGCVVTDDPEKLRQQINSLAEDIPYQPRCLDVLKDFEKNGFHWCADNREIKNPFIDLLSRLTFEAYICFIDDPEVDDHHRNELYDRIFISLIYDRLRDYRDQPVTLCFEQHDSRTTKRLLELRKIVHETDEGIKRFHQIEGVDPPVVISAGKDEPCLAIVDYVCGIFSAYYDKVSKGEMNDELMEKRDFDDLRGKIRLIHDMKKDKFYSRHNPFP